MSTAAKTVRRAEPTEIPALARTLAGAFSDDPVSICRPDSLRPAVLERFFAARMRHLAERGEIWTTEELAGAAVCDGDHGHSRFVPGFFCARTDQSAVIAFAPLRFRSSPKGIGGYCGR